ncbi:PH domain-containing protein [Clostridium algidicarnis]|uniref:PH domain-containing protein n=1 Tax=Clostridium algidicarnis TaxID=37659 RepID=UPI001C0C8637|nr:PH domain-containing protein [Clostridium algidicarnis]MBU3203955.1 PH domain-containing protein [Clostridium algidicarnis]MBU3212109.1 PH domain-containing protein [Clostridium algidicarnis]MBU3221386.1 PH domain-containing protein [Clostridium algidicarnis]
MGLFNSIVQGALGNLSEVTPQQLQNEFGMYLMEGETIALGFKLIRDVLIFTNERIITFDKQGTTGQKMRIESINLVTVVDATAETAGFGLDDSEITITYIKSPFLKSYSLQTENKKFEFPKRYDIQPLYKMLQELAHRNFNKINGF